jgi:hypothetical protein
MSIIELLSLVLLFILVTVVALTAFLILRFGKKSVHYLSTIFSKYRISSQRNFYMATFYDDVYNFISELEVRDRIRLSEEAKQLLILPLVEYQNIMNRPDSDFINREINTEREFRNWRESISEIFRQMRDEPARIDRLTRSEFRESDRTSLSVIKAFANRFCNIPPFCGER